MNLYLYFILLVIFIFLFNFINEYFSACAIKDCKDNFIKVNIDNKDVCITKCSKGFKYDNTKSECVNCDLSNVIDYKDNDFTDPNNIKYCIINNCKEGYPLDTTKNICSLECNIGYDKNNNCLKCNKEGTNTYIDNLCNAKDCLSGYTLNNNDITKPFCVKNCDIGKIFDKNYICQNCNILNAYNYKDNKCTVNNCNGGFILNTSTNTCSSCSNTNGVYNWDTTGIDVIV